MGYRLRRQEPPPEAPVPATFTSQTPGADARETWARAIKTLAASKNPRPVDRLLTALERHASEPVARDFASQFLKDPQLRAIWEEHGKTRDSLKLAQKLAESKEFIDLLARFGTDYRFSRLEKSVAAQLKSVGGPAADFMRPTAGEGVAGRMTSISAPPRPAPAPLTTLDVTGHTASGVNDDVFQNGLSAQKVHFGT